MCTHPLFLLLMIPPQDYYLLNSFRSLSENYAKIVKALRVFVTASKRNSQLS
jgi:hypothetical protein